MTGRAPNGPAVVVRSLAEAEAALTAAAALGRPVTLLSAENAAASVGPRWFAALVAEARARHPEAEVSAILDCGDGPGSVAAALRLGFTRIRYAGRGRAAEAVAAMAAERGATLLSRRPPALDPANEPDLHTACLAWLSARRDDCL